MAYTEKDVKAFAEKDLRISKLAILKSLIEKINLEDVYEVQKVIKLADEYIDYVYTERKDVSGCITKRGSAGCVASNTEGIKWEQIAIGLNFAPPNSQNIKILNLLFDEYKKAYKASANPADVLVHIINTFGKYPRQESSIKTILESLKNNQTK